MKTPDPPAIAERSHAFQAVGDGGDHPCHILVVEDEEQARLAISVTLSQAGFVVSEACQGEEALSVIDHAHAENPVDLVLLDLQMPVMSGFGVLNRLERMDRKMPVIVMTGYGDLHNRLRLMQSGCYDLLNKPFRPEEMLEKIQQVLERARQPIAEPCVLTSLCGLTEPYPAAARRRLRAVPGHLLLKTLPTSDGCIVFTAEVSGPDGDMSRHAALINEAMSAYTMLGGDPAARLRSINHDLVSQRLIPRLVTAQILVVAAHQGMVHVASAGHLLPLLLKKDGSPMWLGSNSDPLGISPTVACATVMAKVASGDRLLVMNGGLLACSHPAPVGGHAHCLGPAGIVELAQRFHVLEPHAAADALLAAVLETCSPPAHDLLVMVIDIPAAGGIPS